MSKRSKKSKKSKILISIIIVLIVAIIAVAVMLTINWKNKHRSEITEEAKEEQKVIQAENKVQIYSGNNRPIAVMIDNHVDAWPHAGINDAYMVYEIMVEGGETRLMALFKNTNVEKIGPTRSSRHYFLDYAMENDAIYTHFGWSPKAQSDISSLKINNVNGIYEDGTTFWRDKSKAAPHNAYTSIKNILASANKKNYRTTSEQRSVLQYTTDEVNLENGKSAKDVKIPYNSYNLVEYKYNEETKRYTRYSKGRKQTDLNSGKDVTTKNIIITFAENYNIANDDKGRQDLKNIGKLKGYYITNGKAIEIICEKSDRKSKTVYKDLQGNEIKVNDGNTFVQICPPSAKVTLQ